MAMIKLTKPDGTPCLVEFELMRKAYLKEGKLCIETYKTIYKAGEYPRKEAIVNIVEENTEAILNKIQAWEEENRHNFDLSLQKYMLKKAKEEE